MFDEGMEEYMKPSRLSAHINAERKALNDLLRSKPCVVLDDKRKQNKHKKKMLEEMLEE